MCQYVVVDIEMCKVPKANRTVKYHWATETIQIGAVLLNDNLEICDKFMTFVSPQYGHIDGFIKGLTGIKGYDLKGAPSMKMALELFDKWIPQAAIMVSWSDTDKLQIKREIEGKNIEIGRWKTLFEGWVDCQKIFTAKLGDEKIYSLSDALLISDIIYEDGAHDGLVDAHNTALLFAKLKNDPEFKLNKYYQSAKSEKVEELSTSLSDLFAKLKITNGA